MSTNGLTFPVGVCDIAKKNIPKVDGGLIEFQGQVKLFQKFEKKKRYSK